eukprot:7998278-Pyramimonas_sp.AAC.1
MAYGLGAWHLGRNCQTMVPRAGHGPQATTQCFNQKRLASAPFHNGCFDNACTLAISNTRTQPFKSPGM